MTNLWFTGTVLNTWWRVLFAVACPLQLVADSGPKLPLVWEPSPSSDVVAYRLCYAVHANAYEPDGGGPWDYVTVTNGTVGTIPDLIRGVVYYVAAVAIDAQGNESDYSNVVEWTAPGAKSSPPAISLSHGNSAYVGPTNVNIRIAIETNNNRIHWVACREQRTQQLLSTNDFFEWQQVPAGEYELQVTVCYNHGLWATSNPVPICVQEPASESMPTNCAACSQVAQILHSCDAGDLDDNELTALLLALLGEGRTCCQSSARRLFIDLVQQEPPSASHWILSLPASSIRTQLVTAVVRSWSSRDPVGTRQWILMLPESEQQRWLSFLERVLSRPNPSESETTGNALLN